MVVPADWRRRATELAQSTLHEITSFAGRAVIKTSETLKAITMAGDHDAYSARFGWKNNSAFAKWLSEPRFRLFRLNVRRGCGYFL